VDKRANDSRVYSLGSHRIAAKCEIRTKKRKTLPRAVDIPSKKSAPDHSEFDALKLPSSAVRLTGDTGTLIRELESLNKSVADSGLVHPQALEVARQILTMFDLTSEQKIRAISPHDIVQGISPQHREGVAMAMNIAASALPEPERLRERLELLRRATLLSPDNASILRRYHVAVFDLLRHSTNPESPPIASAHLMRFVGEANYAVEGYLQRAFGVYTIRRPMNKEFMESLYGSRLSPEARSEFDRFMKDAIDLSIMLARGHQDLRHVNVALNRLRTAFRAHGVPCVPGYAPQVVRKEILRLCNREGERAVSPTIKSLVPLFERLAEVQAVKGELIPEVKERRVASAYANRLKSFCRRLLQVEKEVLN